jgi:hypothetical protein
MFKLKNVISLLVIPVFTLSLSINTFAYAFINVYSSDTVNTKARNNGIKAAIEEINKVRPNYFRYVWNPTIKKTHKLGDTVDDNYLSINFVDFRQSLAFGLITSNSSNPKGPIDKVGYYHDRDIFINTNPGLHFVPDKYIKYVVMHELSHALGIRGNNDDQGEEIMNEFISGKTMKYGPSSLHLIENTWKDFYGPKPSAEQFAKPVYGNGGARKGWK